MEKFGKAQENEPLNVDLLKYILAKKLPKGNLGVDEEYEDLLEELQHFEVNTPSKLISLLDQHLDPILAEDSEFVENSKHNQVFYEAERDRILTGVFYNFTGLTRKALGHEFGKNWERYFAARCRALSW